MHRHSSFLSECLPCSVVAMQFGLAVRFYYPFNLTTRARATVLTACVKRPALTSAKLPSWSRQHRYELHTGGATPYMHLKRNAQVTEAVSSGYLAHFVHTCLTLTSHLICLG